MWTIPEEKWPGLLGVDPRPWLVDCQEPSARWVALRHLLDVPPDDSRLADAHGEVLGDAGTQRLISLLPDWETHTVSGHNRPDFAPNLLVLLSDMGVAGGDDHRIEALLDAMLAHVDPSGRFASCGRSRLTGDDATWGAVLCDSHAVLEALVRFGRAGDERAAVVLKRVMADMVETTQGPGWPCVPHTVSGWRGPGRKNDVCPQVTLEALRLLSLPEITVRPSVKERRPQLRAAARTALGVWRNRGTEKPYMFGHGRQFKRVKWPTTWYDVHCVLDTLGRYPELWGAEGTTPEGREALGHRDSPAVRQTFADRQALAELAACLIAYNFGPDGRVIPRSTYKGFEGFSFGQKKTASAFATARLCVVLRRVDDLTAEIAAVDITALGSSKGGSGTCLPP